MAEITLLKSRDDDVSGLRFGVRNHLEASSGAHLVNV